MMRISTRKKSGLNAILLAGISTLLVASCGSNSSPVVEESNLLDVSPTGSSSANLNLWNLIDTLPYEALSDDELAALDFMREEEKLARDVYQYLYDIWGVRIFVNIAESEQTHMDAVLRVIHKYSLADPAEGKLSATDCVMRSTQK